MGSRFATASLARVRAGTFKARKAIPPDVRADYARLYGQRWEAIFSAPASTLPAEAKAAHAEWLALVERRIAACRHNRDAVPITGQQAAMMPLAANGGPICRVNVESPAAAPERQANLALFDAYVLDKQPAKTTISRWRAVFAVLDALPAPLDTQDAAQQWLDGLKTPERSARTVRDCWLAAARTVYRWAKRRRMVEVNPFDGCVVEVPRKIQTRETGRAFTDAEARTILYAAQQVPLLPVGARGWEWAACRRWVPWLCAYTGCRPGEATQLRARDVERRPYGSVLRLTPEAGTIKTGKVRIVPIHAHLFELGFPQFAEGALAALGPEAPLFYRQPDRPSRNPNYRGPAVKARERLAAWVREQGVTDPGISPNHAWRHLFKTIARRAWIEASIRDAICGHAPRSTAESYEHLTVEDLAEAIKRFPRYAVAAPPHGGKR
jgi:integrase